MDFLSSDRSTFSRQVRLATSRKPQDDGLFFWAVLITILTGLTAFSWIFCMYVFHQPEKAFNYSVLTRCKKIKPLVDFDPSNAPRGKFNTARDLYAAYHDFSPHELREISAMLRRRYVLNFHGADPVTYVQGTYHLSQIKALTERDIFPSGLALRGQSEDYPNIEIEYLLPAPSLPEVHYDSEVNGTLEIGTSSTCAAVINVAEAGEDRLLITAVPIVYGAHETPARTEIRMEVPKSLNLYGPLPVTQANGKKSMGEK